MKSTSRSSRLVRSAARSPALAMTGPEVARKFTPSSRATICASVVLPNPGGPTRSTWSSASLRVRAALAEIAGEPDHGRIDARERRRLVLELGDDALRELRPDAGGARNLSLVAERNRVRELRHLQRREERQAEPRPHALHAEQEP